MSANQFIEETISNYKSHLEKNFRADVVKMNLINTTDLLKLITGRYSATGDQANLSFQFPFYGIYQDIKKRNQAGAETLLYPRRKANHRPGGAYPWYNKNLWSTIGFVIRELLLGYSADSVSTVKKHFPSKTI